MHFARVRCGAKGIWVPLRQASWCCVQSGIGGLSGATGTQRLGSTWTQVVGDGVARSVGGAFSQEVRAPPKCVGSANPGLWALTGHVGAALARLRQRRGQRGGGVTAFCSSVVPRDLEARGMKLPCPARPRGLEGQVPAVVSGRLWAPGPPSLTFVWSLGAGVAFSPAEAWVFTRPPSPGQAL